MGKGSKGKVVRGKQERGKVVLVKIMRGKVPVDLCTACHSAVNVALHSFSACPPSSLLPSRETQSVGSAQIEHVRLKASAVVASSFAACR